MYIPRAFRRHACAVSIAFAVSFPLPAFAQDLERAPVLGLPSAENPFRTERDIIGRARTFQLQRNETALDAELIREPARKLASLPRSVLLARRGVMLCAAFVNNDEREHAELAAKRILQLLAKLDEPQEHRVERLYWQALLESRYCYDTVAAIRSLKEAEGLAPEDERVINLLWALNASLAEFGR